MLRDYMKCVVLCYDVEEFDQQLCVRIASCTDKGDPRVRCKLDPRIYRHLTKYRFFSVDETWDLRRLFPLVKRVNQDSSIRRTDHP